MVVQFEMNNWKSDDTERVHERYLQQSQAGGYEEIFRGLILNNK